MASVWYQPTWADVKPAILRVNPVKVWLEPAVYLNKYLLNSFSKRDTTQLVLICLCEIPRAGRRITLRDGGFFELWLDLIGTVDRQLDKVC